MVLTNDCKSSLCKRLIGFSLAIIFIVSGMVAGRGVHDHLLFSINTARLEGITRSAIERVERAADYSVLVAFDVSQLGQAACAADGQELRKIVNRSGMVKNIVLQDVNLQQICAALVEFVKANADPSPNPKGVLAKNDAICFNVKTLDGHTYLEISWKVGEDGTILVYSDLDGMLFDFLPSDIRDQSHAVLKLSDGQEIAQYRGPAFPEADVKNVAWTSDRYPLSMTFSMDNRAFAQWNQEWSWLGYLIGGLMGGLVALALIRELNRPIDPRTELLAALKNGEFRPFYQPTFDLATGSITGCEVLMRRIRPDGTIVPPMSFIPQAETTGAIIPMTRHIVRQALQDLGPVLNADPKFHVAFNIVAQDFASVDFIAQMKAIIQDSRISEGQVVFELTERQHLADDRSIRNIVQSVREAGFRVALDDTGTGHNGLSHVQSLGVDIIKIDKRFVDFVETDQAAHAIVEMLIRVANRLGMETIAEGIESEAQKDILRAMGVNAGQGYLVSKPVPATEFINMLAIKTLNSLKPPAPHRLRRAS